MNNVTQILNAISAGDVLASACGSSALEMLLPGHDNGCG
jgi:hypothetical protein